MELSRLSFKTYIDGALYLCLALLESLSHTDPILQSFFEEMDVALPFLLLEPEGVLHLSPPSVDGVKALIVEFLQVLEGLHFEIIIILWNVELLSY